MSLRAGIGRRIAVCRQDSKPPGRRLFAAHAAFLAVSAPASPKDNSGTIDLGREADFALGRLRIHPSTCEVAAEGRREIVQPRPMQVLVALARAKGAVVSRDQLIETCWDGRVIGEDAINRAIAKVRAVAELTDPAAFEVETIPRIGFRLKVFSTTEIAPEPASSRSGTQAPGENSALLTHWKHSRTAAIFGVLAAAAVLAVFLLWPRSPTLPLRLESKTADSVAVLPFLNMSGDPAKEYFSDGFSEELLNDLANTPQLRVAARTSSFAFKGKPANVQEIASKLHVRAVLEGSVRESGDRVRITAQLIDAASGYHLWSQTYDRQLTDILKVQDEIARAIASALTKNLTGGRAAKGAVEPEAYRKYLLGKSYFDRHNEADNERAIALFKEVTTLAPDFSDGFAMLGYAYLGRVADPGRADRSMATAVTRAALDRSLALNPRNLTALIARMDLALFTQNWNAAGEFVHRMHRINSNNAIVARASGLYYQFLGFPEQSRAAFTLATQFDPLSHVTWGSLAVMDAVAGRNDEAIAAGETALSLSPDSSGVLAWVCIAHAAKHEFTRARQFAARLRQLPDGLSLKGCELEIARVSGDRAAARQIVEERVRNKQGDPAFLGQNYLLVGEYEKAVPLLRHAYDVGDTSLYTLSLDPLTPRDFLKSAAWKELTQRPRFRAWQAAHDRLAAELRSAGKE